MKNRASYIVLLVTFIMSVSSLNLISAYGREAQADQVAEQYVLPFLRALQPTWRQFNFAQWLVTGVAALEILFSVHMAYKCIKRKPRFWGPG